jgi:hypothetical protein
MMQAWARNEQLPSAWNWSTKIAISGGLAVAYLLRSVFGYDALPFILVMMCTPMASATAAVLVGLRGIEDELGETGPAAELGSRRRVPRSKKRR